MTERGLNRLLFGVAACATVVDGLLVIISLIWTLDWWLFELVLCVVGIAHGAVAHWSMHVLRTDRPQPIVFERNLRRTLVVRAALAIVVIQLVVFIELFRKDPAYGAAMIWSLMMLWGAVIAATMGYGADTSLGRTLVWLLVFPRDVRIPMKWRRRAVRRRRQKQKHRELIQ